MSIFYDTKNTETIQPYESLAKGKRTDFRDNFSSAWDAFTKTEMILSEINNLDEAYGNMNEILTKAGHFFISPTDPSNYMVDDTEVPPSRRSLEEAYWKQIAEVSAQDENLKNLLVEAGLDTQENMHKLIAEQSHSAWENFADISERATTMGKVGGFTGIASGAFTDPVMLATLPISMMYSVPANLSKAAWKVAKIETVLTGIAETAIQLKSQPYRKELGFEDAGLETGLKNIAMVSLAAGTISPALLGVFRAFGKGIEVGKKHLFKLSDEELNTVSKEMGEINPKFKDETLDNHKLPEKDNPFPDNRAGRTEHNERLNDTLKAIQNGEDVNLTAPRNQTVPDNLVPPGKIKPGEFFDIFDNDGNIVNVQAVAISKKTGSIKIKLADGSERVISIDPKSSAFQSIRNPNYVIRSTGLNAQGKTVSQLKKKELTQLRKKLQDRKNQMETEGTTNQGAYRDTLEDLNSIDFNINKATNETNSPNINKANFNKNESKLAEDLENVKDFDVPSEAAYRNQALNNEVSMFDTSTSSSIKSGAEAGAAAKTSPTVLSDKLQDLTKGSQKTDATPVSVLAKANTVPPLFRGSKTNKVGDKSAITKKVIYHKSDDFNTIYNTLSKKIEDVKKELQPIATKYNGDLKARIKKLKDLNKKINKGIKAEHISDYLGARISTDTILEAKLAVAEINKKYKIIGGIDDFLTDAGRAGTEYRAVHIQALTNDGFTFEIQIRVKDLDPLTEQSHTIYKKKKWAEKEYTDAEYNKIVKEEAEINKKLKAKYFEIKDKEFIKLNSDDPLDFPIPIGQRVDEATGEKVALTKTARELFEEEGKTKTMLERLKDCV